MSRACQENAKDATAIRISCEIILLEAYNLYDSCFCAPTTMFLPSIGAKPLIIHESSPYRSRAVSIRIAYNTPAKPLNLENDYTPEASSERGPGGDRREPIKATRVAKDRGP